MEKRVLPQNLLICTLITMLGATATSLSSLFAPMAEAVGLPASAVGVFISVYMVGSGVSVFFAGPLADRLGKRRVVAAGTLLLTLGLAGVAAPLGAMATFAGLFVLGVGFGPSESMGSALLTDENGSRATLWMNLSQIGFGIGAIAAPALIARNFSGGDYRSVFALCAAAFFMLFVAISLSGRGQVARVNPQSQINSFVLLKNRTFLRYVLLIFLYMGYESVAPAYLKQFFLDKDAGEELATLMISLFWASMLVSRLIGAFMGGRELFSIQFFTLFVIAGAALTLIAPGVTLRIAGVVLFGFGCGPVWTMIFVLASRVFPDRSGAACGLTMLFSTAGGAVFPSLIGAWVGDARVTLILCIAIAVLVVAVASRARRAARIAL